MANPFRAKPLTGARIVCAIAVAVAADGLQIALGPVGWVVLDQVIDVVAMILTTLLLGFHPLLLPTFVVELLPVADMIPTWTGCVGAVIFFRKRSATAAPPVINTTPNAPAEPATGKVPAGTGPVIDV